MKINVANATDKTGLGYIMGKTVVTLLLSLLVVFSVSAQDNDVCLGCHEDTELTGLNRHGQEISMFVTEASLDSSIHAGMSCIDCHSDLEGFEDYPHDEDLKPVNCANCHDDVAEVYAKSAHGEAEQQLHAATCASCHGTHNILPSSDPSAMTSKKNLPYTCSSCHHRLAMENDPEIRVSDIFDRYMKGIHAEGLAKGIGSSANCSDCHGVHDLRRSSDPESKVHKMAVPGTCSKCHNDIYIQYSRGIHGKALAAGILDSPNCTDCHGEHEILPIDDPSSPVNLSNQSDFVCARCHNDPRMIEKYGMKTGRFTSYQDSYHGLAVKGGLTKAATCTSCHKAHEILPSSNPVSSIHPDNLTETCQKCHPQANDDFAASYSHQFRVEEYNELDRTIQLIYIILIVLVIGGMIIHNLIILIRYIILKYRWMKGQETVSRFNGNMVFQHIVVAASFIVLVITGFALRYPDQWWVSILNFFGIFEETRSVIHRIAAVFLVYISFHHLFFITMARRGREEIKAMAPNKNDLPQVFQNLAYHLGLRKEPPHFGRYDYTEKAEYWALAWGTVVMAATGLILWFPTFFTSFLPAWSVKVAETIHLYEAWLATLAIAFFHFFFVIFHPDQYPMSLTWLNGQITKETLKHHHPAWHEQMEREKEMSEEAGNE